VAHAISAALRVAGRGCAQVVVGIDAMYVVADGGRFKVKWLIANYVS